MKKRTVIYLLLFGISAVALAVIFVPVFSEKKAQSAAVNFLNLYYTTEGSEKTIAADLIQNGQASDTIASALKNIYSDYMTADCMQNSIADRTLLEPDMTALNAATALVCTDVALSERGESSAAKRCYTYTAVMTLTDSDSSVCESTVEGIVYLIKSEGKWKIDYFNPQLAIANLIDMN